MIDIFQKLETSQNPYRVISELFSKSNDKFTFTLGKILADNFKKADRIKSLVKLNKLNLFDSPHRQISFIYFLLKSTFECKNKDLSEAKRSCANAKEYLLNNDQKYIHYWISFIEGKMIGTIKRQTSYLKIIKQLNLNKNIEFWLWHGISWDLAEDGLLSIDLKNSDIYKRYQQNKDQFNILFFANCIGKGKTQEAKAYLSQIPIDQYDMAVSFSKKLMDIMEGKLEKEGWIDYPFEDEVFRKYYEFKIALMKKEKGHALEIAKEIILKANSHLEWPKRILAEAEICNKNIEPAVYLLEQIKDDIDYMDHLLFARIEYQKNNIEKAAQHFQYSQAESLKHGRHKYFEFNLKCAIELEATDVFILMEHQKKMPDTKSFADRPHDTNKTISKVKKPGCQTYIGSSSNSQKIKNEIRQYANINMPVLITGETGVGKEVVAQALHDESNFAKEPFLPINCGAILGTLLQSELFGHKAGAFTSAQKNHIGIFEAAGKGTVFLDEFGEMSAETQVSLLRVLETKRIRPIGANQTKSIHCRVIAATNANLEELVKTGKFRSDLYYRLKSLNIKIAPLRKRKKDILDLALFFINKGRKDKQICQIDQEAIALLNNYDWPGNARELQNEMQKISVLNSQKNIFYSEDFHFLSEYQKISPTNNSKPIKENSLIIENEKYSSQQNITLAFNSKSTHRRMQRIKDLFTEHKTLRRIEIINTIEVSQATASKDLKFLISENFIKKVMPTKSSRTHYFELI